MGFSDKTANVAGMTSGQWCTNFKKNIINAVILAAGQIIALPLIIK